MRKKKLSKKLAKKNQKMKKHCKKFGYSPCRPRKATPFEIMEFEIRGHRDSLKDIFLILTGRMPEPRKKVITAILKGDILWPIKPSKQKTYLIKSEVSYRMYDMGELAVNVICRKAFPNG